MSFSQLGLSEKVLAAVQAAGYTTPTPIQQQAIPHVLARRDVLGIAQTGTGKTAAFTLPMLTRLEHGRARARMPRTLILEPTRELAAQVQESFEKYGAGQKLNVALVIDEADRMLDMGFIPDIERICKLVPFTRQTLFFTATMPPEIRRVTEAFLHNPQKVEVSKPATAAVTVTQSQVTAGREPHQKREVLRQLLREAKDLKNAIIFCNRKRDVAVLHKSLQKHGFSAGALHGDMDQPARMAALEQFRKGEVSLLVASDVAARGLDIPDVSHVFNFDVPHHPDDYVHRIGRTGRAGRSGTAITIVAPADTRNVAAIEKLIGQTIPWMGKEPHASAQENTEKARTESGEHRKGDPHKDAPRKGEHHKGEHHKREHRNARHREHARPARRDNAPAPVTRLDQVRPRRADKPAHADESAGGHLPAFLLRPFRVKA